MSIPEPRSSRRPWAQRIYTVPVLGYLVHLCVALARLPRSEPYFAALIETLSKRVHQAQDRCSELERNGTGRADALASRQGTLEGRLQAQAGLLAEATALLDELREAHARERSDLEGRLGRIEEVLPVLLNDSAEVDAEARSSNLSNQPADPASSPEPDGATSDAQARSGPVDPELDRRISRLEGRSTALHERVQDLTLRFGECSGTLDDLRAQIEVALSGQEEREATMELDLADRDRRLDEVGAIARDTAGRLEFVRRELLFELRHGSRPTRPTSESLPRILDPEAVERAETDGLRLNIGCGHVPLDGFVNVDERDLPTVQVQAEAAHLPFGEESVLEIHAEHLLEHFPHEELRRTVLPHWFSRLEEGGVLRIVVPDSESMVREYREGRMSFGDFREATYGSQDYDGDFHYTMFTPASLEELLDEAGFVDVRCSVHGRRNGQCLEFESVARRPPCSAEGSSAKGTVRPIAVVDRRETV